MVHFNSLELVNLKCNLQLTHSSVLNYQMCFRLRIGSESKIFSMLTLVASCVLTSDQDAFQDNRNEIQPCCVCFYPQIALVINIQPYSKAWIFLLLSKTCASHSNSFIVVSKILQQQDFHMKYSDTEYPWLNVFINLQANLKRTLFIGSYTQNTIKHEA